MVAEFHDHEAMVLHNALLHQLHKVVIDEGQSPIAIFIMVILTTFGKLPTPATHQVFVAHDLRS